MKFHTFSILFPYSIISFPYFDLARQDKNFMTRHKFYDYRLKEKLQMISGLEVDDAVVVVIVDNWGTYVERKNDLACFLKFHKKNSTSDLVQNHFPYFSTFLSKSTLFPDLEKAKAIFHTFSRFPWWRINPVTCWKVKVKAWWFSNGKSWTGDAFRVNKNTNQAHNETMCLRQRSAQVLRLWVTIDTGAAFGR